MRRREFITLLGGAAAGWPLAARAQRPATSVIGYLHSGSPPATTQLLAAFREGLSEIGYVEGQNLVIEFRWAQDDVSRLPDMAADLARRRVAVIAAPGSTAAALAAKAATTTIPIVFSVGFDPVQLGLVASLNRPGGNITGVNSMSNELVAKRLGLLHELLPAAARFAVLVNPNNPTTDPLKKDVQAAAAAIGRQVDVIAAGTETDIDTAFATLVQKRAAALLSHPDVLFITRRAQVAALAPRGAGDLALPHRCRGRRPDELRSAACGRASPSRGLHRPHPQGRQPRRAAGRAADQIRASHQPQDRQGARPDRAR